MVLVPWGHHIYASYWSWDTSRLLGNSLHQSSFFAHTPAVVKWLIQTHWAIGCLSWVCFLFFDRVDKTKDLHSFLFFWLHPYPLEINVFVFVTLICVSSHDSHKINTQTHMDNYSCVCFILCTGGLVWRTISWIYGKLWFNVWCVNPPPALTVHLNGNTFTHLAATYESPLHDLIEWLRKCSLADLLSLGSTASVFSVFVSCFFSFFLSSLIFFFFWCVGIFFPLCCPFLCAGLYPFLTLHPAHSLHSPPCTVFLLDAHLMKHISAFCVTVSLLSLLLLLSYLWC